MSDVLVVTFTVAGAVTAGCVTVVLETPATGCVLTAGRGGVVDALAPDLLAEAVVEPPAGVLTCACVGAETLGLTLTEAAPAVVDAGGLTLAVAGAFAWTLVFTGAGGTCAATGCAAKAKTARADRTIPV